MFHPNMLKEGPVNGAYPFIQQKNRKVWNRTGAATVVGQNYKLDLQWTANAAETVANAAVRLLPAVATLYEGDPNQYADSAFNNIIVMPNVSAQLTYGCWVIALQAVADNELCEVCEVGICGVIVDGATQTWPAYSVLIPKVNSAANLVYSAAQSAVKTLAISLVSVAQTSTTLQTVSCFFNGWGFLA